MSYLQNLAGRALRKAARIVDPPQATKYIADEYLNWLCFANAGMLEKGNIYLIDYAIKHLPSNAPILEIGSFCGLSTNVIAHIKRIHSIDNPLITCDKWEFEGASSDRKIGKSPVLFSDYKKFVKESYLRNIQMFSQDDLPRTFEMTADELFAAWKDRRDCNDVLGRPWILGGPISFCYIDGNHTYEYAKRDFVNCDEYLQIGGFLLFDDSTLGEFTLHRLMPELTTMPHYRLIATNPYHLFQKVGPDR
jgi:hypothetical protein